jgi:agmatine/peptidylarginine deiminase
MKPYLLTLYILIAAQLNAQIITTPPTNSGIRAMAEWEELQALNITWAAFPALLKQIVAAGRLETQVLIITDDPAGTEDYLMTTNTGGPAFENMDNVTLIQGDFNSIWTRDYSANPVYGSVVDSLFMVDWIYNRPRPDDDATPVLISEELSVPLYATTQSPYKIMNTGGNFMCDGFGTAFASNLILDENDGDGDYDIIYPIQTEEQIDNIMNMFMGIDRYIKMPILPFDGIHHIDMHMKLVNENTLLVSEYPEGVADGPQINANIEYVLANFNSMFDTPYNVVRIPAPPSVSGLYPDNGGAYRTYTNGVFVNNTIIFPTYREEYDTTAYRIWGEACPGYTLVGIDCDNQGNNIISQSGAIHCITHSVGVSDPLLISHLPLEDTFVTTGAYTVNAYMNHKDGIASGILYYSLNNGTNWAQVSMTNTTDNNWSANIPAQPVGTIINYYVQGTANTGKVQVRPMPAPQGFWTFEVLGEVSVAEYETPSFGKVFPNPAGAITCVELNFQQKDNGHIFLVDMSGKRVMDIHNGNFNYGINKFFFNAESLEAGVYRLVAQSTSCIISHAVVVK